MAQPLIAVRGGWLHDRLFKQLDMHDKSGLFFGEYLFCTSLSRASVSAVC
jgi:hypothetical protein